MIKGMTVEQFRKIEMFINEHHKFALHKENYTYKCKNIKYIDMSYDTRDGLIWQIKFRGFQKRAFDTNFFSNYPPFSEDTMFNYPYLDLYAWVMSFLKDEWKENELYKKINKTYFK